MTLKIRLIALTAGALMLSLLIGGTLVYATTAQWLQAEMTTSADVARALVRERLIEAAEESESPDRITQLLEVLERTQRVHARFVAQGADPSADPPPAQAPGFLAYALGARPIVSEEPVLADGSQIGRIVLVTDPQAALAGVWRTVELSLSAIMLVSVSSLALIAVGLTRSLRAIDTLGSGLARVAQGDYRARLVADGPPDIARLATQFNAMAAELDTMRSRTHALTGQLLTVQEEARREIARDLHDELGPCLLAASLDLSTLQRLDARTQPRQIEDCAASLGAVLDRMRALVRRMIDRLHLDPAETSALGQAVTELALFWQERCPAITWTVAPEAAWDIVPPAARLPVTRVIREAVANAIRHGDPRAIAVDCRRAGDQIIVLVRDDGSGIDANAPYGTGMAAMRERLAALGGILDVRSGADGTEIRACLPIAQHEVVA